MSEAEKHDYLAHPHDLLVRNILSDADMAADLFQNYLPPEWVAELEWDRLRREPGETVAANLAKLVGDLRYSTKFKGNGEELKVFVFLEHQSRPDRFMSFRMLEYVCAAYRQQLPLLKNRERFPYPLAVVLHHGETPWKKIPSMRELIAMRPNMASGILDLPICLIDLAAMQDDQLHGHPMVCALLDSLQSASTGTLPSRIRGIVARLRGLLGREQRTKLWAMALARYYAVIQNKVQNSIEDLAEIFAELYDRQEAEKMATTMYEAIQEEGVAKGVAKGVAQGIAQGMAQGITTGKIESIITILESRFSAIPAVLQEQLRNLRDDAHIAGLLRMAATCQNLKEFQQSM